ncbi:AAA family ATPase [Parabacteroides merdae]|uniref:AAA family ATPase n=2 Tax=Parabacteroides merdae TaxID=46503 RepID=UPI0034A32F3B
MINKITISGVASYKNEATLETDKNINLIYGINGSGKSTFSEYLRKRTDAEYTECSIEPVINDDEEEIFVYNENYVEEVFYNSDYQRGVFSLSKENVDAHKKIDSANTILQKLYIENQKLKDEKKTEELAYKSTKSRYIDLIWKIKTLYTGGDRVLDFCFTGLKGSKETLFHHVISVKLLPNAPTEDIDQIKKEIIQLNQYKGTVIPKIPEFNFIAQSIENQHLFEEVITGNPNSRVAKLIDKLHNSDWVKAGLELDSPEICPFCQRPYGNDNIISELKSYFNTDYENALDEIKIMRDRYKRAFEQLPVIDIFSQIDFLSDLKKDYNNTCTLLKNTIESNIRKIDEKYKNPSVIIKLDSTVEYLNKINEIINSANEAIDIFNKKILSVDIEIEELKQRFWSKIRYDYNQSIIEFNNQTKDFDKKTNKINEQVKSLTSQIEKQRKIIATEQNNIINIDASISHINGMLVDMGITDFKIDKYGEDGLYRIIRGDDDTPVFKTLSEGERTIISILYFLEACQGVLNKELSPKKRIIVIDDPISSLSNLYIFNIGRILRSILYPKYKKDAVSKTGYTIEPKFEQVFILTHSLYFFYEMTEMDENKRHTSQALFRISKSETGSKIQNMHYEHIQSDYQAYWMAIRDPETSPALIANCMRNIIEYFFNFVEKKDLNNVFSTAKFQQLKYQAFLRYINRESHSLGQNIYDFKEFDYTIFHEALKMVFEESGYSEHYKKMMKLK